MKKIQDEDGAKFHRIVVDDAIQHARLWMRQHKMDLPTSKNIWQYECALLAEEVRCLRRKVKTKKVPK